MTRKSIALLLISISFLSACRSLDTYDMVDLNHPDMGFSTEGGKNFENYMESIREGGNPSGGSKSNGGCGCN